MPILEDSGIESEDKSSLITEDQDTHYRLRNGTVEHMEDLEVTFRTATPTKKPELQSTSYNNRDSSPVHLSNNDLEHAMKPANTCRILQRKLELKVERAKRNYSHYQEENVNGKRKSQSASLIPIGRLSIPGDIEQKPLVDYQSESDYDECEDISFFPGQRHKGRSKRQTELSDTFSIQEMAIDSDLESNDSQNLELYAPHVKRNFLDFLATCFCLQPTS